MESRPQKQNDDPSMLGREDLHGITGEYYYWY